MSTPKPVDPPWLVHLEAMAFAIKHDLPLPDPVATGLQEPPHPRPTLTLIRGGKEADDA